MRRSAFGVAALVSAVLVAGWGMAPGAAAADRNSPPGVSTRDTDTEGVVYVDAQGRTLYTSPYDKPGESNCTDAYYIKATRAISGQSYYLPGAEARPTCVEQWPPLLAATGAKAVGDWTPLKREDGTVQWAFRNWPVYRSALDEAPGDVNGVTSGPAGYTGRMPLNAELGFPPGVTTRMTKWGRALAPEKYTGVFYTRDRAEDGCDTACRNAWRPFIAPAVAVSQGDWAVVSKGRGFKQWAYKGKPLYSPIRIREDLHRPLEESPGWRPAIYHPLPAPPSDITTQVTPAGLAYADRQGRTVYFFNCIEETPEHEFCDVKGTTPLYRLTMCGGPQKCMQVWRPVLASPGQRSPNRTWTVVKVDPATGAATAGKGLDVWAYRGRPLYTHVDDEGPGDTYGDGMGMLGSLEVEMINLEFHTPRSEIPRKEGQEPR
jgi:predicted lipoprotein with Yx(FWY)xxD motif